MKSRYGIPAQPVLAGAAAVLVLLGGPVTRGYADPVAAVRVPVVFDGGHDTDPRDRGRPVILVASALGVPPEVFRAAFTHVHPAPAGSPPSLEEQQRNKAALLTALAPYGVTNERLDAVSDYYRYVPGEGPLWPTRLASAYALVSGGKITRFVVTDGGSGYSSPPTVTVPGVKASAVRVHLLFSKDAETNGSVADIQVRSNEKP